MGHPSVVYIFLSFILKDSYCSPTYGPFQLLINKVDICAGPRNKNCTSLTSTGTIFDGAILIANFKVLEDISPSKGKIVAMSNGREIVRLQMNKPCKHLFLRPLFETIFRVSKSCEILKGDYKLKLDMQEMADNYYGGSFFYGNISFKAVFYGSDCNFSCTHLFLTLSPKT